MESYNIILENKKNNIIFYPLSLRQAQTDSALGHIELVEICGKGVKPQSTITDPFKSTELTIINIYCLRKFCFRIKNFRKDIF